MHRSHNLLGNRYPSCSVWALRNSNDARWECRVQTGSVSGAGACGGGPASRSGPGLGSANEAAMLKMTSPFWMATTRRAENEKPSRSRSTWKTVGRSGLPARRKYPCSECGRRPPGTVSAAAYSACAATWPP